MKDIPGGHPHLPQIKVYIFVPYSVVSIGIFDFLHALRAAGRSDFPLDAVSAAGPVSTHGKDNPGLGAPNSRLPASGGKVLVVVVVVV